MCCACAVRSVSVGVFWAGVLSCAMCVLQTRLCLVPDVAASTAATSTTHHTLA